jgi:hypothetical protein
MQNSIPEDVLAAYFRPDEAPGQIDSSSGISYKEKLKQMKQKKQGGAAAAAPAVQEPSTSTPEPPTAQTDATTIEMPTRVTELVKETPQVPVVAVTPEPLQQAPSPEPIQQVVAPLEPEAIEVSPLTSSSSPEEIRQKIRILMGLVLKHRGGPGFGTGHLKGPEVESFENLYADVAALLKDEALQSTPTDGPMMLASPEPAVAQTSRSPPDPMQVDNMIACIEGAVTMYKNCPPELKETVLLTLRAALLSAINTCNNVMTNKESFPQSSASGNGQVDSMIACIEGAITMYKNSPPELKESILMALRAALMSAVDTCNKVLANNQIASSAPVPVQKPLAQTAVAPKLVVPTPPAPTGDDENSILLDRIYSQIKNASGDGRFGLKPGLSADEASDVADKIVEMRGVLMNELDSGIPAEKSEGGSSSTSKYQQMLAKTRAEKSKQ